MIRYVKKRVEKGKDVFTTRLHDGPSADSKTKTELLWGDRVRVIGESGAFSEVRARALKGFVRTSHLGATSLLELYFIDVGQGDGVLIRTPDHRHLLIDGGWPRKSQPTGKNAADFVDWKFVKDYEGDTVALDAMICSHNDQDHYGGLWDLLDPGQSKELDAKGATIERFYHAGLSWWRIGGSRSLGSYAQTDFGDMWTQLLEDRASLSAALAPGAAPPLQGEWRDFLEEVSNAETRSGQPTPVQRLSHAVGFVPGFDDSGDVSIRVLGPVEFEVEGVPAIRRFGSSTSQNTNGNSVLLRVDYGGARILLTGDLNQQSQHKLMDDYAGELSEFAADVTKACHHGSGDISLRFLEAVNAACTIISSGDSEGHDHPRPEIVAASGLTGFRQVEDDKLVTPLVYSTELARSVALGRITDLERKVGGSWTGQAMSDHRTKYKVVMAGDRSPKSGTATVGHRRLATSTTYGLINVRTDGQTIMCAALNEKDKEWNVSSFRARFGS